MDPAIIGAIGLVAMLVLLAAGVHVAFCLGLVGIIGIAWIMGWDAALAQLATIAYGVVFEYEFSVAPLFLLMGMFIFHAGLAEGLFRSAQVWLGKLPGGLALATNLASGLFGAVSGSSLAAAAVFTRIALPEMLRYKYKGTLAAGTIAAAGTFASLIPPSGMMILYGILTETSIGALFIAGIVPGIITILLYGILIIIRCTLNPSLAPKVETSYVLKEKFLALKGTWPVMVLALIVIGGIYSGVFTATESGGVGAFGAFVIALVLVGWRRLNIGDSLRESGRTTAMILAIVMGALLLSRFVALTRIPFEVGTFLGGLPVPRVVIMLGFLLMYMVLGCFLDSIGMMAITVPIVLPITVSLGYDPVWFGIFLIKTIEIGMITPPLGMNVYIVKGAAGDSVSLEEVFKGIAPFVVIGVMVVGLLLAFPQIVLWLPSQML